MRKKINIRVSALWGLMSSNNTHITEEIALRHRPGATEMTPKNQSKTWKTWKTYVNYEVNWKSMKRVVNPLFQKMHFFQGEMSTFVKPTRKQEKNTSKHMKKT